MAKRLTRDEAVRALDALNAEDGESAHGHADDILLAYVPKEVKEAYERVMERAGWWATA